MNTKIDMNKELNDTDKYVYVEPVLYEKTQCRSEYVGITEIARDLISTIHKYKGMTYAKAELALEKAKQMLDNECIVPNADLEEFYASDTDSPIM